MAWKFRRTWCVGDMMHNNDSNLSLTTVFVAVVVVSVFVLHVFHIPFPKLSAFQRWHPQCNTFCLAAVGYCVRSYIWPGAVIIVTCNITRVIQCWVNLCGWFMYYHVIDCVVALVCNPSATRTSRCLRVWKKVCCRVDTHTSSTANLFGSQSNEMSEQVLLMCGS